MKDNVNLKPCPFCGSTKLKVEIKASDKRYNDIIESEKHTASVRCNKCHARGSTVSGIVCRNIGIYIFREKPSWATTDEELKRNAEMIWNIRVDNEPMYVWQESEDNDGRF